MSKFKQFSEEELHTAVEAILQAWSDEVRAEGRKALETFLIDNDWSDEDVRSFLEVKAEFDAMPDEEFQELLREERGTLLRVTPVA